jgi:hypothetical protein
MTYYKLILGVLGIWRLTHLLAAEDGPFQLLVTIRKRAGSGFWGSLMDCFYCLSLWVAIPFAVLLGGSWQERLLLWPALSGAAILLNRMMDRVDPEGPAFFEEPLSKEEKNNELLRKIESASVFKC